MSLTRRTKDEKSFQNVQNLIKRRGEENFSDGVKIPFTTRVPHNQGEATGHSSRGYRIGI